MLTLNIHKKNAHFYQMQKILRNFSLLHIEISLREKKKFGGYSHFYPRNLIHQYRFLHLGIERHYGCKVPRPRTWHNDPGLGWTWNTHLEVQHANRKTIAPLLLSPFSSTIYVPDSIAFTSSLFHSSATSLANGSSGLGALSSAWIDNSTVRIWRAGLHLSVVRL